MTTPEKNPGPVVMILDGDYRLTLHLAEEVVRDLGATVIGVGSSPYHPLLRSKYCHVRGLTPKKFGDGYQEAISRLIREHRPDAILTAHHHSVTVLDAIKHEVPEGTELCIPEPHAIAASLDKSKTLAAARRIGIGVPQDYTSLVQDLDASGRRGLEDLQRIPFPVYMKSTWEAHSHIMAKVETPVEFWPEYDRLRGVSERAVGDETVLVQEYVNADGRNYCYSFLFVDGEVALSFGHEKVRSAPREAGVAVRARVYRDERLRAMSEALLREMGWRNGVALAEYKKRPDGSYALLEVNCRFWGAYALAKKSGYHFASTLVARNLGLEAKSPPASVSPSGEIWFARREVKWLLATREGKPLPRLAREIITAWWPPCRWDTNFSDYPAWLSPGGLRGIVRRRLRKLRKAPQREAEGGG